MPPPFFSTFTNIPPPSPKPPLLDPTHQYALRQPRQTGSISDYQLEFETVQRLVLCMSARDHLDCFISGLREDISRELRLLRPYCLSQAIVWAKEIEAKLLAAQPSKPMYAFDLHLNELRLQLEREISKIVATTFTSVYEKRGSPSQTLDSDLNSDSDLDSGVGSDSASSAVDVTKTLFPHLLLPPPASDQKTYVPTIFTDLKLPIPALVRYKRVPCNFEPQSWPPPSSVTRRRLPLSAKTEPRCSDDIIFGSSHHCHAKHLLPIRNDATNTTVGDGPLIDTSPYDPGPLESLHSATEPKHLRCFSIVHHTVVDNVGDLSFKGVIEPLPKEIDATVANLPSIGRFSACSTRETHKFAKYISLSYGRHMFVEMPTPCLHSAPAVFVPFSILTDPHGAFCLNAVFSYLIAHCMNSGKVSLLQCDKTWNSCDILEQFSWVLVVGMKYEPFLNFFLYFINTTYSVVAYDSATGSVPPGPAFGEDDFRFGLAKWLKVYILRLRPTFIPSGQHFSTRVGIFTHDYVHRLSVLQIQVIPLVSVVNEQWPGLTDLFYIDLTTLRVIVDYLQNIELVPELTVLVHAQFSRAKAQTAFADLLLDLAIAKAQKAIDIDLAMLQRFFATLHMRTINNLKNESSELPDLVITSHEELGDNFEMVSSFLRKLKACMLTEKHWALSSFQLARIFEQKSFPSYFYQFCCTTSGISIFG